MISRRGPRWVYWPAKLVWAPALLIGIPLVMHLDPATTRIDGGWRILVSLTTPDQWVSHLATFLPGLFLTAGGLVAFGFYQHDPGPGRAATALDYPLYSLAGWIFGITAVLALWRTSGHVAEFGSTGLDWRFLASLRTEPLDYVVIVIAAAASLACMLASWGFVGGRWATPPDAHHREHEA